MLCYHICWWNKVVYKFGGTRPTGRIACLRLCTTTLHIITVSTLYVEQVVNLAMPSLNSSSWPSSCFMICLLGTCKNGWTDRDVLWVKTRVLAAWRRPTSSGVRRTKEVNPRRARLVPGWVTVFGRYTISVCNQRTRSTQPCIPPGSLNRVPASAAVRAGTSSLPGCR